jgi:DedD protein
MAEQTTESDNDSTAGELRGQLVKRLAVAGVLVAILLGVLAFFDHLANLPDDSEPTVFTSRCRSRRKRKCRSRSRRPKTCLNHRPPEKAEVAAEAPPPPSVESQPAAVVEVKPEPAAESRSVVTAKPEPAARLAPTPAPKAVIQPPVAAVPEATTAPSNLPPAAKAAPAESAPARPAARLVESKPSAPAQPPVVNRLFSGFLLQAGVFPAPSGPRNCMPS